MSAADMSGENVGPDAYHYIRDGRFVCTAPADASCRNYPACECEVWTEEHNQQHPPVPQETCWIEPWINASDLEDSYEDDPLDVMTRDEDGCLDGWPDGPVATCWEGDYVSWTYDWSRPSIPPALGEQS